MPRDGSNVYHIPPGTEGIPDTVIESAKYNSYITDVEQDLNSPRPILAGGTGATSADAALIALGGEKAGQIVTNYDSHAFVAGSFSSASSATGAPAAEAFAGICYKADDDNFFIEARSFVNGNSYARGKVAGVWGVWVNSDAALDTAKVNRAGDTMTGLLNINLPPSTAAITLTNTTGNYKKHIRMGATSELEIVNSANTQIIMTLSDGGELTLSDTVSASGSVIATDGAVWSQQGANVGTFFFGSAGGKHLTNDGTTFIFTGSPLLVNSSVTATGVMTAPGYATRTGLTGIYDGAVFNITSSAALWVNSTNLGTIAFTSDYRTKKDVSDLQRTWNVVKELRPISYRQRDFGPLKEDNSERWGFIAHELQNTMIQSAATGSKDSRDYIQSPNPWTVLAALTRALQEAMARIEALETK